MSKEPLWMFNMNLRWQLDSNDSILCHYESDSIDETIFNAFDIIILGPYWVLSNHQTMRRWLMSIFKNWYRYYFVLKKRISLNKLFAHSICQGSVGKKFWRERKIKILYSDQIKFFERNRKLILFTIHLIPFPPITFVLTLKNDIIKLSNPIVSTTTLRLRTRKCLFDDGN